MTTNVRRFKAYHEAGHAVVAHLLGMAITNISMMPGDGYCAAVQAPNELATKHNDPAAMKRGLYDNIRVAFAGAAALQLAGYPADIHDNAHADDKASAVLNAIFLVRIEVGLPMHPSPNEPPPEHGDPLHTAIIAILARAWPETKALLRDNWQFIVRVADVLTKRDQLSQAEFEHVVARGQLP